MNNDTEVSIKFRNSITGENKLKQYGFVERMNFDEVILKGYRILEEV